MQLKLESLLIESNKNRMGLKRMSRLGAHLLGSKAFKVTCVHMWGRWYAMRRTL